MKRYSVAQEPLAAWMGVATSLAQLWLASAEVIAARSSAMLAAGAMPGVSDRRELDLMWQEKVLAGMQSFWGVSVQMTRLNQDMAFSMLRIMTSAVPTLLPMTSASAYTSKLVREGLFAAATLSGATARLARGGIDPVHRRAHANVARLRKKRAAGLRRSG